MKLTQEQVEILGNGKIEENRFYLQGQLSPKEYKKINEVLETIGLKWNRGKKAHIIDGVSEEELKDAISDVIETGEVETLKETIKKFQFFPTPEEVVNYMIELADIEPCHSVLEPSAGQGAILDKLLLKKPYKLRAIELNSENYRILTNKLWEDTKTDLNNIDFLQWSVDIDEGDGYDRIVMNPPFAKSQDVKHILHAFSMLNEGGVLVSVAPSSILSKEQKLYQELRDLRPEVYELPEGSFKESGTMINTVILVIRRP